MTNYQFGSDSSPYCDNNLNALVMNGDKQPLSNGTCDQHPKSPSNSISIISFGNDSPDTANPEKPPYNSTTMPIDDSQAGNKKSSVLHLLHLIAVVVASATINGVVFGVVNNFGVFYVYLIELFQSDTSLLSLTNADEPQWTTLTPTTNSTTRNTLLQPLIGKMTLFISLLFLLSLQSDGDEYLDKTSPLSLMDRFYHLFLRTRLCQIFC